jgi:short-subunit dehydrogenase
MQINGSTVLLTGASGGLGQAIARELARRGARLVLTARNEAVLSELAEEVGGEVVVADLSRRADVDALCDRMADVDVLVCNAGVGGDGHQTEVSPDRIDTVLDVNLRAPMQLSNAFARARIASGRAGQIVMVGSVAGLVAAANTSLYNATKFGLRGFTLAIRQDYAVHDIGVTHLAPGFIHTAGMFADNDMELPPLVRARSPRDVAAAVAGAITNNPAEAWVIPPELRATATLATIAPGLSERLQRAMGIADMTRDR